MFFAWDRKAKMRDQKPKRDRWVGTERRSTRRIRCYLRAELVLSLATLNFSKKK